MGIVPVARRACREPLLPGGDRSSIGVALVPALEGCGVWEIREAPSCGEAGDVDEWGVRSGRVAGAGVPPVDLPRRGIG